MHGITRFDESWKYDDRLENGEASIEVSYTGWRKFLAWTGLIVIIVLLLGLAFAIVWANLFIYAS